MKRLSRAAVGFLVGAAIYGILPTWAEVTAGAAFGPRDNFLAWSIAMLTAAILGPWVAVRMQPNATARRGAVVGILCAVVGFVIAMGLHFAIWAVAPKFAYFILPHYWVFFQPFLWLVALAIGLATADSKRRASASTAAA